MTKKTEWSHLPNAVHIDRVLASLKANPEAWTAAWSAAGSAARRAARDAARRAAWTAAWSAAGSAARGAAWTAARTAAWTAARTAAWTAALDAIAALVAWDRSSQFLDMTANELKMWQSLSEDPAVVLLLPAVVAFEQIKELELI